ncbi:MAG: hypothetical protein JNK82_45665 [Myxococcaceae bacterium]|nr:hypothetical protein [Myxococcaceae bacterium]
MRQLAFIVFVSGCSVSSCSAGSNTVTVCSGTVQGKLMGTFSVCNELDQRYRANLDTWAFTANYTELPTVFTWSTDWEIKGEPRPRQFSQEQPDTKCNITMKKGSQTWVARHGAGVPASGTCQLTLDVVNEIEVSGNVTTYKVKGSVTALLEAVPGTGASDTVNVSLALCQGDAELCPPMM